MAEGIMPVLQTCYSYAHFQVLSVYGLEVEWRDDQRRHHGSLAASA